MRCLRKKYEQGSGRNVACSVDEKEGVYQVSYKSDNLNRDIDRYLQDDMECRTRLPVCSGCGDHITEDRPYLDPVDHTPYCSDCWHERSEGCRVPLEMLMEA